VDLSAPLGQIGTLLLDPQHIVIKNGTGTGLNDASLPTILALDSPGATFTISETALEAQAINTNIILQATDNITIEDLTTDGILTFAGTGTVTFIADANFDGVGAFTMLDPNDIIQAPGRSIYISAASITTGEIQTNQTAPVNNALPGGAVTLLTILRPGNGNITTGNINTASRAGQNNSEVGGAVSLVAGTGNILTGDINTTSSAGNNNAEDGGNIFINTLNGSISTGNLQTYSESSNNNAGQGGSVALSTANGGITTGLIDSAARATNQNTNDGGNVNLSATQNITTQSINTQSSQTGGNITIITDQQFVVNGAFTAANAILASLSSIGGNGSGSIAIQTGNSPFQIGGTPTNGTVAAITTGNDTLAPTQTLTTPVVQGDLQILGIAPPPSPPSPSPPSLSSNSGSSPVLQTSTIDQENANVQASLPFTPLTPEDSWQLTNRESDQGSDTIQLIDALEKDFSQRFAQYLGLDSKDSTAVAVDLQTMQATLQQVESRSSHKAGLVYLYFGENEQLEVILITARGAPVHQTVEGATRTTVQQLGHEFQQAITNPVLTPAQYLPPAQALYQQLIAPIQPTLDQQNIQTLAFVLDEGLRSLPLAALHDGQQFLVESYSLGVLPTFSLTDFSQVAHHNFRESFVLGMGIESFQNQLDLFAVPLELALVTQGKGATYVNDEVTQGNLEHQLSKQPTDVVHLATHAVFRPGSQENSYIQLWDQRLTLDQVRQLPLDGTALVVLSACTTALGDRDAEYGFAGFAVSAGSQSALASLWSVSDEGTLGFMTEFYRQLAQTPLRAEALRLAQIAMLRGDLWISDGVLYGPEDDPLAFLPQLAGSGQWDFSHPAYWSAFTMVGNPW
jgi:CHAT domain-containing protein